MSVWTHVAGVIRVDDIRFDNYLPNFDKIVGKECLFESSENIWRDMENNPNDYMPYGSEGTLQKSVWINPNKSDMAAYTISIFGDLRDYEEPQPIIDWFIKVCDRFKCIRQAVITVETEGQETLNYVYKNNN